MITAPAEQGPLDVISTRVEVANAFTLGQLVSRTAAGWVLADQTDNLKTADGVVSYAQPSEFRLIAFGVIVRWPEHALGSAGQRLWVGTGGGYVTAPPVGGTIRMRQWVAKVLDDDNVLYYPFEPFFA